MQRAALARRQNDGNHAEAVPKPKSNEESDPRREWQQPLNRADSIGILAFLVGIFFILITPTIWYKVPALVLLCFGFAYFLWLSHWTYRLGPRWRIALIILGLTAVSAGVVPQLVAQWHMDHMHSELTFKASLPGIEYPDGVHYGIKWEKSFVEVRLTVASQATLPIQNLNLSVSATDKQGDLAGLAQTGQEPGGCVVRKPRFTLFPPVVLRGADGSRADISPYANDQMNDVSTVRDHYDLLCQRILPGESIPLVIAVLPQNAGSQHIPSSELHVNGDYEITVTDTSKIVHVDETVPISTLPPWK